MTKPNRPSPNFNARPAAKQPAFIILHYTGMQSAQQALDRLTDAKSQVSAHYLIEENGQTRYLVDEKNRAWHAGKSAWKNHPDLNDISIGIELVNPGHEYGLTPFPAPQMEALLALCKEICTRHPSITQANILGHSDIAPDRKKDPGELFNWQIMAQNGFGFWPEKQTPPDDISDSGLISEANLISEIELKKILGIIGYDITAQNCIAAFQRHYRPADITNLADAETTGLAISLLQKIQHKP